jgi:hypothetical protein
MYRDFRSVWEGFAKNATEILGTTSATLAAAAAGLIVGWTTLLLPILLGAAMLEHPSAQAAVGVGLALFGSAVVVGIHLGTARHLRIPPA